MNLENKKFILCELCFERLARQNISTARFWIRLCDCVLKSGPYLKLKLHDYINEINQYVSLLEKDNFIVTYDIDNDINLQVLGISFEEDIPFFCTMRELHI
jgi:hypothetical protein